VLLLVVLFLVQPWCLPTSFSGTSPYGISSGSFFPRGNTSNTPPVLSSWPSCSTFAAQNCGAGQKVSLECTFIIFVSCPLSQVTVTQTAHYATRIGRTS